MKRNTYDLPRLLAELDPHAELAQRHLWLIHVIAWVRAARPSTEAAVERVRLLLDALEADPDAAARLQLWWQHCINTVDITTLLADFGFAPRTAFFSEVTERLRYKLLPHTPETIDASELFVLALHDDFDVRWLQALDEPLLLRLSALLQPEGSAGAGFWQHALLGAITYCAGQILSTGFAPELRLRMSEEIRDAQPFHALIHDVESLRVEVVHGLRTPDRLEQAEARLRERLDACRAAVGSVYAHFASEGISVGLVFRLRQLRTRIVRVRQLLDCLLSERPQVEAARLLAGFVSVGRDRHSLRALYDANSSLLAAKITERSAETGDHYITRTPREYLGMVRRAAGGGLVMSFTTLIKLALHALALSAFWGGFIAGVNYAISFVLIQLLHFTVATKQPAMTAPAMAAKLKDLEASNAVEEFVDEVANLTRSQVAAILGNVLVVAPAALGLSLLCLRFWGHAPLDATHAMQTLDSLSLLGPSVLFAAFTGVLLYASSILGGWAENWFVLRRMDSAIRYNPSITQLLGRKRAQRWSDFLRQNISGFTSNISLGFMLGLTPAIAGFFGLGLEVRHVTLSSGQIGVATASLGLGVLHLSAFWWAVAMLPFNGALNVLVSFSLAFRTALRAHNVTGKERSRIYAAIRHRLRTRPLSFFAP
ncbi:MAG: site-specific recombinase [Acidovorax sp.]|jgi:site-specific recombinase|nr:site-specific recombinase [Acidovorax sp.]MDR3002719.1 site-specific recombinase [Acidovorax sp.]